MLCALSCCCFWSYYNTLLISVCEIQHTEEELPTFESVFERNRGELEAQIKATEVLLDELQERHILTPENINCIKVS